MRILIEKNVNLELLREQLYAAFPDWAAQEQALGLRAVEFYRESEAEGSDVQLLFLQVPDEADTAAVQAVIDAHDAAGVSQFETALQKLAAANSGFKLLQTWATVTPSAGYDFVVNNVFAGQTEAQVSAWIDLNVTTLAQAKTALKQSAAAIIALRDMEARLAQGLLYLRDLIIK